MAVVVQLVIEPTADLTEADIIDRVAEFATDAQAVGVLLSGAIVGLDRRVDLVPSTYKLDES